MKISGRFELEDDGAEYEHEEDTVVDYDEKYVENETQEDYADGEDEEGDIEVKDLSSR